LLKAAVLGAGILLLAAEPGVKKLGNAIIEYRDKQIHAVAAYEYSSRQHDTAWLMFDVAIVTAERLTFDRTDFSLVTPDGLPIPVAPQRQFVEDPKQIRNVRQNATIWKRDLSTYFVEPQMTKFQFVALPGDGVVTDSIVTWEHGVTFVTLFFNSPEGRWNGGTYSLIADNGRARAALPIELK
jgi:hypothetical protein